MVVSADPMEPDSPAVIGAERALRAAFPAASAPSRRAQMKDARDCMDVMNAIIKHEREIGRRSGFVNAATLHWATSELIRCERKLAALTKPTKRPDAKRQ